MITRVKIINFRNIRAAEYDLAKTSIIAGKNNLGKSNTLNAINWILTNKLLTDKYGEGESDIQSIVPNTHKKGEHTEVSIWLDSGTKYTKVLRRGYDRETGKVNKHDTEYLINDAKCSTQKEFYETLYNQLRFHPVFTKLKVDESRLFTDPLYALLKLDYKELRHLLVAMGCTVDNETLFNSGFQDFRAYEVQYMGKWDVMRKNLQSQKKSLDAEIKSLESQISMFSDIEDYDTTNLDRLQQDKEALIIKRKEINTIGLSNALNDIENQITKLGLELEEKRNSKKLEISAKINDLTLERKTIGDNIENEKIKASSGVIEQINKIKTEQLEVREKKATRRLEKTETEYAIKNLSLELEQKNEKKDRLAVELGELLNAKHEDFICPICGSPIDLHKADTEKQISVISYDIQQLENDIENITTTLNAKKQDLELHDDAINNYDEMIVDYQTQLDKLDFQVKSIQNSFNVDDKIDHINAQIRELENDKLNIDSKFFESENAKINELIETKNNMIAENQKAVNQELEKITLEINELDEAIKQEHIQANDYERKQELEMTLDVVIHQSNDNEHLLARLNQFIQAMIKAINDKAKEITGFDFVMLEENLTNDGITECCYIVDENGIPFKDINTARKTEMGIRFIEMCKKVAVGLGASENTLPILVDRFEGIDDINKIAKLTTNQLICTRVSMDEKLTIIKGE